jgi:exopolysaccharide production protein ExoQ
MSPQPAGRKAERGMALLLGALLGLLIIYQTIPWDIFTPYDPTAPQGNQMSANSLSRTIKLALLGIGAVIILRRFSVAKQLFAHINPFFRFFLFLVPLSYLWSISPSDTMARYMSILTSVSVCVAFCVAGWHPRRFQNVLRPTITLLLVGSVVFGLMEPDLAIEHGEGTLKNSWHGLTAHKNLFGQLATYGVIFWLHAGLTKQVKPWQSICGYLLGFTCGLLSRSSTSMMATLSVTLFMTMMLRSPPSMRRYMPFIVAAFATIVLTYAIAVLNLVPGLGMLLEPIAAITGKDMTFSNRSEIWRIIKEHIQLSPLLGSGYGAYWIGPVPWSPSFTFMGQMFFYPTESHNGYLEIVNDLGYLGLLCLGGMLFMYVRQSLSLLKTDRPQAVLFLGFFFQQAIVNLSESCWLVINSGFVFSVTTMAMLAMARALMDRDLQPARPRVGIRPAQLRRAQTSASGLATARLSRRR